MVFGIKGYSWSSLWPIIVLNSFECLELRCRIADFCAIVNRAIARYGNGHMNTLRTSYAGKSARIRK